MDANTASCGTMLIPLVVKMMEFMMEEIIPSARNYMRCLDYSYYDAYVEGCLSVEGNTRDICDRLQIYIKSEII